MLRVDQLTVAFGPHVVLSNLSFRLGQGESLGLAGESGSGKSIAALAIMGLLPQGARVVSGAVHLDGVPGPSANLLHLPPRAMRGVRGRAIAMVFQEPMTSLNPAMRCGHQLDEATRRHLGLPPPLAKRKSLELLAEMQLPDPTRVYRAYPHQLSGGQKQRAMIAMALAGSPSLLIADEPTTALDVTVQKEIVELLGRLTRSRGMGLIFISHDLAVLSGIAQRLIVMRHGVALEQGATGRVLTAASHPYTQALVACRPPLRGRPLVLPTIDGPGDPGLGAEGAAAPPVSFFQTARYQDPPMLSLQGVEVVYPIGGGLFRPKGALRAVSALDFEVYPGETLGLVGESGCGKSTVGRAIVGLVAPRSGRILFRGTPIDRLLAGEGAAYRRQVQMIFQDPYASLNPRHTVGQALMEPLAAHRLETSASARRRRALELLEQVALPPESFYRYPHEFSGGQRQRVAIARALAMSPQLIVCDEIVSALDVSVQAQILNLLNRLKVERGLTYIFISHDLSLIRYMSSRVLVMRQGQMVESGPTDRLFQAPATDYTRGLIDAIPSMGAD